MRQPCEAHGTAAPWLVHGSPRARCVPACPGPHHTSSRVSPAQLRAGCIDQGSLKARALRHHVVGQDEPLESEVPWISRESGGNSPPTVAFTDQNPTPQPTNLYIADSRLMPKEHTGRTKTQILLANSLLSFLPTSCSPIYKPCQWLVALGPVPSPLAPRAPRP